MCMNITIPSNAWPKLVDILSFPLQGKYRYTQEMYMEHRTGSFQIKLSISCTGLY